MAKKNERAARHAIIVDMNDFLMDYAAAKLGLNLISPNK